MCHLVPLSCAMGGSSRLEAWCPSSSFDLYLSGWSDSCFWTLSSTSLGDPIIGFNLTQTNTTSAVREPSLSPTPAVLEYPSEDLQIAMWWYLQISNYQPPKGPYSSLLLSKNTMYFLLFPQPSGSYWAIKILKSELPQFPVLPLGPPACV